MTAYIDRKTGVGIDWRWQDQGACLDQHVNLFYKSDRGQTHSNEAEAKAICAACPVIADCLATALKFTPTDDFGIWGGTTEAERATIRRRISDQRRRRQAN